MSAHHPDPTPVRALIASIIMAVLLISFMYIGSSEAHRQFVENEAKKNVPQTAPAK